MFHPLEFNNLINENGSLRISILRGQPVRDENSISGSNIVMIASQLGYLSNSIPHQVYLCFFFVNYLNSLTPVQPWLPVVDLSSYRPY